MNWIMYIISFILGAISMFMMVCIGYAAKQEEPINRVHFYVARDKNGLIYLYLSKPTRRLFIANENHFKDFGLSPDGFKDLKWGDEPIEVFVNIED